MRKVTHKRYAYKFNFNTITMLQTSDWDTSNQHNYDHMYDYPFINSFNYHEFAKQQSLLAHTQGYNRSNIFSGFLVLEFVAY